jgi:hypothetical protein
VNFLIGFIVGILIWQLSTSKAMRQRLRGLGALFSKAAETARHDRREVAAKSTPDEETGGRRAEGIGARPEEGFTQPDAEPRPKPNPPPEPVASGVVITGIYLSFWPTVTVLLKLVIAAIPATALLTFLVVELVDLFRAYPLL